MTNKILHVATVAMDTKWADIKSNIVATDNHIQKVLELFPDTQIILFPELSLTGFVLDESNQGLAEPLDGPAVNAIQKLAVKNKIAIIAGMITNGTSKPFNTTFVVDANGKMLAHYNKNHLFTQTTEPDVYEAGKELSTFELHGWKCGLSICFDIRFPELYKTYKQANIECIFTPFNWVEGRNKPDLFNSLIKTRAHENQVFFAAVDRSGHDPNTSYHGISLISNPYGEDITERKSIYSYAALAKKEIASIGSLLPLCDSFKDGYKI